MTGTTCIWMIWIYDLMMSLVFNLWTVHYVFATFYFRYISTLQVGRLYPCGTVTHVDGLQILRATFYFGHIYTIFSSFGEWSKLLSQQKSSSQCIVFSLRVKVIMLCPFCMVFWWVVLKPESKSNFQWMICVFKKHLIIVHSPLKTLCDGIS